jgi:hypothetical protein
VEILHYITDTELGYQHLLNTPSLIHSCVLGFESHVLKLQTRAQLLDIIALACKNSTKETWIVLDSFNHLRLIYQDSGRFDYLGYTIQATSVLENKKLLREHEIYLIHSFAFVNTLLSCLEEDKTTFATVITDLNHTRIPQIAEMLLNTTISGDLEEELREYMNITRTEARNRILDDPVEITRSTASKLRGTSSVHFAHIVRVCSIIYVIDVLVT